MAMIDLPWSQQLFVKQQPKQLKNVCSTIAIKLKIEMTVKYDLSRKQLSLTQKWNNW